MFIDYRSGTAMMLRELMSVFKIGEQSTGFLSGCINASPYDNSPVQYVVTEVNWYCIV